MRLRASSGAGAPTPLGANPKCPKTARRKPPPSRRRPVLFFPSFPARRAPRWVRKFHRPSSTLFARSERTHCTSPLGISMLRRRHTHRGSPWLRHFFVATQVSPVTRSTSAASPAGSPRLGARRESAHASPVRHLSHLWLTDISAWARERSGRRRPLLLSEPLSGVGCRARSYSEPP